MSDLELSSRGKRQLKSILHTEIKEQVDEILKIMIPDVINKRIDAKLNEYLSNRKIESLVKQRIDGNYWEMYNKMLQEAKFQDKLTEEIITYLNERWACGVTPFEEQFDKALMRAVKTLIGGARR